jgi:cell division protease FtsH
MAIKAMIESYPDRTFIVMTSEHLQRRCVKTIYDIARRLAPSVVVLEDIDSAGGLSRKVASHPILGEVLQALNGVSENKGVFTVATTNFVEDLDDALRDRPGRFDVIITIGLPDSDARYPMLEKLCEINGIKPSEKELARLVTLTKDFSGAWLAEVFSTATLVAMQNNRIGVLLWSDILSAVDDIQDRRRIAYQKTPVLPPPPSNETMSGDLYR